MQADPSNIWRHEHLTRDELASLARPRKGSRATGTNPRAQLSNPRAMGTNPSAGSTRDAVRVYNLRDVALQVLHSYDRYHCDRCSDTGSIPDRDRRDLLALCHCRPMTSREAQAYLNELRPSTGQRHATAADYLRQERRQRRR